MCVWFLVTKGILNLVTEVPSLLPNVPDLQYNQRLQNLLLYEASVNRLSVKCVGTFG